MRHTEFRGFWPPSGLQCFLEHIFLLSGLSSSILHLSFWSICLVKSLSMQAVGNKSLRWPPCHLFALQTIFICKHFALQLCYHSKGVDWSHSWFIISIKARAFSQPSWPGSSVEIQKGDLQKSSWYTAVFAALLCQQDPDLEKTFPWMYGWLTKKWDDKSREGILARGERNIWIEMYCTTCSAVKIVLVRLKTCNQTRQTFLPCIKKSTSMSVRIIDYKMNVMSPVPSTAQSKAKISEIRASYAVDIIWSLHCSDRAAEQRSQVHAQLQVNHDV